MRSFLDQVIKPMMASYKTGEHAETREGAGEAVAEPGHKPGGERGVDPT